MFGDEREGLAVVGVADAVESGVVVSCDSGSVGVGFAHLSELVDGGHVSRFGGGDDAHGQSSFRAARRIAGVVCGVA